MASQANSTKHSKKKYTNPLYTLPKFVQEGTHPKIFYDATITLIPKSNNDTTKKENYWPITLRKRDANFIKKILSNRILKHIKKDKLGFISDSQ